MTAANNCRYRCSLRANSAKARPGRIRSFVTSSTLRKLPRSSRTATQVERTHSDSSPLTWRRYPTSAIPSRLRTLSQPSAICSRSWGCTIRVQLCPTAPATGSRTSSLQRRFAQTRIPSWSLKAMATGIASASERQADGLSARALARSPRVWSVLPRESLTGSINLVAAAVGLRTKSISSCRENLGNSAASAK